MCYPANNNKVQQCNDKMYFTVKTLKLDNERIMTVITLEKRQKNKQKSQMNTDGCGEKEENQCKL